MIEFCLLMPWYIFLFVGAFDFGFYAYALIATSNASRVGAVYCSATTSTCASHDSTACTTYVIGALKDMPNIGSTVTSCSASPLTLTVTYPTASTCPDGNACDSVAVAYQTPLLIPIPGVFPGQITITRTVTMRIGS